MKDYRKMADEELLEEWGRNPPKCAVITGTTDKFSGMTIFRREDIQDLLNDEDLYE